jgi:hypothetical protein
LSSIVRDHESACRIFGDEYCFKTKHGDILYEKGCKLRKLEGVQEADRRKLEMLRKAVEKRQPEIDRLTLEYHTIKTFTEDDLPSDGKVYE